MISWIKLDINILDDAKIKIIRSHPDGNSIVVLWIGLLCLAMKSQQPGIIEISNALPYTIDDLSNLFNVEKKTVELGLALFRKYKMVDLLEDGAIEIINFKKHQSIEEIERRRELTRLRVANHRKKFKPCNALLTHDGVTVTPTDKIRQDKIKRGVFAPPSVEVVLEYCRQRNNSVDPKVFVDFYTAKNWMIGKNKMKDWKAAVRTWETRDRQSQPEKKSSW